MTNRVENNSLVSLKLTAKWQDKSNEHFAIHYFHKFNIWRDIDLLPQQLIDDIIQKTVGEGTWHSFLADEIIASLDKNKLFTIPEKNFIGRFRNGQAIIPKVGRFYPRGMIDGIDNIFHEDILPLRIISIDNEQILVDCNHPLVEKTIEIKVDILSIDRKSVV